jgi:hypothetical protein
MWRSIDVVWTDVSEESIASMLEDFSTLKMKTILSSETSVHTISTRRHIQKDGILQDNTYLETVSNRLTLEYESVALPRSQSDRFLWIFSHKKKYFTWHKEVHLKLLYSFYLRESTSLTHPKSR